MYVLSPECFSEYAKQHGRLDRRAGVVGEDVMKPQMSGMPFHFQLNPI